MIPVEAFIDRYYVDRKQTDSVKWDGLNETFGSTDLLPLWVADMDFKIPEKAREDMIQRIDHGVFGYSKPSAEYYKSFTNWQKKRHNINLNESWIRFSTGVVNSFNYMVQRFTNPGESVLVLAPVYYPFFDAVTQNNRQLVVSELVNESGHYSIDFDAFETAIVENDVSLFLHCSPQNPVGRIWTEEELKRLFDICVAHDVIVVSDEIHQDFVRDGHEFISALRLHERYYSRLVVLTSASKTFNLASLLHSHIIIPDKEMRDSYDLFAERTVNNPPSLMGMIATESCYKHGEEWLDGLQGVIEGNYQLLTQTLAKALPEVVVTDKQATYLAWIDLSAYISKENMKHVIQDKAGLAIDYGEWFRGESTQFIRVNLATSPEVIKKAIKKLIENICCE